MLFEVAGEGMLTMLLPCCAFSNARKGSSNVTSIPPAHTMSDSEALLAERREPTEFPFEQSRGG